MKKLPEIWILRIKCYIKDTHEKITRNLDTPNNSKHRFDDHGIWQLGYCREQNCNVFMILPTKVENRKSFGISTDVS
jgi:hypothetical protein